MTWRNWLDGLRHSITSRPRARRGRKPRLRTVSLLNQQMAAPGLAWQAESLEDRALLSAFNESGATLTLNISTASASVAITAGASSYTFTLTGDTWSGSDSANVSGNGTNTLTVTSAGLTAFNTINLGDSASGVAVNFNDSGANSYSDDFNVTLDDAGAGTITFSGATPFSGASDLSVSTTRNIVVSSGSSVTTASGDLTLSANRQGSPTSGNFHGISVSGTVSTTDGNLDVAGRAGVDGATSFLYGVAVIGGTISGAGTSRTMEVDGIGNTSSPSFSYGIVLTSFGATISSAGAHIQATGQGGNATSSGIVVDNNSNITNSGGGDISLTADYFVGTSSSTSVISAAGGTVTFRPKTASGSIDLGTVGAGTLSILNTTLDRVTANTIQIGDVNSGAITFSADITRATNINLTTGANNNIAFGTFSLNAGSGGDVTLTTSGTGAITTGDNTGTDITGDDISLNAGSNGIGTTTSFVRLAGATVTASTSGNGGINLVEADSVTIAAGGLNAGAGTITLGGGTFSLGGSNRINNASDVNLSGGATLAMGTNAETIDQLLLINGSVTGSGAGTLTGTSTFDVRSGSVSAILAGSGVALTKSTGGTVTLSGANTYTGATTISAGTLSVSGSLSNSTDVSVAASATYDVAASDTIDGLSGAGNVTLGANTLTVGGNDQASADFSGVMSGTGGGLTKTGSGDQILSGTAANTYTGLTSLTEGRLLLNKTAGVVAVPGDLSIGGTGDPRVRLEASEQIANTSNVTIGAGGFNQLNFVETIGSLSGTGNVYMGLGTAADLIVGNSSDTTFSGDFRENGNLVKTGSGTLTLSGSSNFTGTTTVSAGTLKLADSAALGSTAGGTTVSSGGVLDLNGQTIGAEAVTLNGTGISSGGALINSSGTAASLSGNITVASASSIGGSGNATYSGTVNGANTLTLVGAGTKLFSGIIGGGTPLTGITQNDSTGAVRFNQNVTVGASGATFNANVTLDGLTLTSGGAVVFGNAAADMLTISGAATTVNATSITNTATATSTVGLNLIADAVAITGAIGASGQTVSLKQKTNAQLIHLGAADSAGTLGLTDSELDQITAWTINIGDTNSGTITISAAIGRSASTVLNVTAGSGNNIVFSGAGSLDSAGGNVTLTTSGTGAITSGTATTDIIAGAGTVSLNAGSGGIGASGNAVTASSSNAAALTATTSGNGNQFLAGTGTLTLSATGINAGTGTSEITGGTLALSANNEVNDNTKINVNGGTLAIGTFNETVNTLTLTSGSITGSGGTLTSTNTIQTQAGSISAILGGSNGLTQSTAGTTILTGANTYTGATTINGGTLRVNGSTASGSAVTVNNGGTLGGSGTIGGTVNVVSGGTVAPGNSPGVLSTGSYSQPSGATLTIEIDGPAGAGAVNGHDQLSVTGTVTLGGTLTLDLTDLTSGEVSDGQRFIIIANNGTSDAVSGTFNGLADGAVVSSNFGGSGKTARITYFGGDGNDVAIVVDEAAPVVAVPNDGNANSIEVQIAGDTVQVIADGVVIDSRPLDGLTSLEVTGVAGQTDTFEVDLTTNPGLANLTTITFTGNGDAADKVIANGAAGGSDVVLVFDGADANKGTIQFDGGVIVEFDGIGNNTIALMGTDDLTITFGDGAADIVFADHATANTSQVSGTGFVTTTFTDPASSLTINLGANGDTITFTDLSETFNPTNGVTLNGGAGADVITFVDLGDAFGHGTTGALTVAAAGGADSVDFDGATSLASLSLTAETITQSAALTVSGTTSLTAGAGDITLTTATNDFQGVVNASGANIDLTDAGSIQLGTISATTLDVVANGAGTITQDATSLTVTGAASFTATGDDITLTDADNNFSGAVSATGDDVDLTDAGSIQLGTISATTLDVVANGAGTITQNAGGLTVTGASSFTATGDDITLTTASNNFGGAVSATGDDVDLTDANSIQLGTISATTLDVVANGAGTITQNAGGLTVTGASSFTATGDDITLTTASNNFGGAVSATGDDVDLTDAGSIQLGTISATTLDVIANGAGTITQDATSLTVTGASSFTATGDDITLTDADNNFSGAVSASGANIDLTDAGSIQLGTISATTLDVVANGAGTITQDATSLTVTGAASFTATGDDITLTDADNNFGGAVSASGANIDLTDAGSIQLGTISATTLDVVANGAGTITQDATSITVTGAASFTATGDDITLTDADNNFGGAVSASGANIDLTDANSIQLGTISATTLDVVANGAGTITQNAGGLTVTGASSFTATGDDITLTTASNNFGGAVSATGDDVDLTDAGSIQLGTISATTLDVVANGAGTITQDATSLTVTGASSFTATGDDITLTDADNNFGGAVSASGANIDLTDANSIQLGTISAATLDVIATGAITQDATSITVTGAASFNANSNAVTLADTDNDFQAAVSVSNATTVSLVDANSINIGSVGASSTVSITALSGSISDATDDATTDITAGGTITLTATANINGAGADGRLDLAAGSTVDASSTTSGSIALRGAGTLVLSDVDTASGSIDVLAAGQITATDVVAGGTGNVTLRATAGNVLVADVQALSDTVTITSDAGAIEETGADAGVDIDGRDLVLTAATGIGATGTIEIDAFLGAGDGLTATVTGTGPINVADDGNLRVLAATTNDGAVTISAAGALTVDTSVTAGGTGRNVTLTTTSGGDVTLSGTTTAAGDQVQINSAGSINGASLVTGSMIDLNAVSGIGNTTPLMLTGSTISADSTTSGNVVLNNALATAVSVTSLTTGNGSVQFNQSGGGDLTTGTVTVTSSATLTNSAGAIALDGSVTADSLVVNASGAVTDGANGDLAITTNASLTGGSITLGNDVGNATSFGTLTFNSAAGAVSITEDNATQLTGTSTADSLTLVSAGAVTDATGTSVTIDNGSASITGTSISLADNGGDTLSVSGTASFNGGAGAITVAAAGSVSFGSLTFNTTGGAVSITEDDATQLTGTSTGDSLTLVSAGAVTDATGASVTIDNGNASITGTSISLADNGGDTLSVSGTANFNGGAGAITVAAAGSVNFGSLTFNTTGGAVSISEDSAMTVFGASTAGAGLTLVSADDVTLDATINVTGATSITAGTTTGGIDVNAKLTGSTTILLDAADEITIDADIDPTTVTLQADDDITINAAVVAENLITVSAGQDGSGSVILSGTGSLLADNAGNTADITISTGGTTGSVTLTGTATADDTVTVNAAGSINGAGLVTATTIDLNAGSGIGDTTALELAGSTITADTTNGAIDLDNALGTAVSATSLTTGSGSVRLDQSGGGALTTGTVTASTSATLTNSAGAIALDGSVTADSLVVNASGAVTDGANGDLAITNNASITGSSIALGNDAGNSTNFGSLTFNSAAGAVVITEDSATQLTGTSTADSLTLVSGGAVTDATNTDVTIDNGDASITGTSISLADNAADTLSVSGTASFNGGAGAITVASAGSVNFGSLTFNTTGGAVSITEDDATQLTGTSTADSLTLVSGGAVTDATGTSVTIDNGNASITGTSISLTDNGGDTLSVSGTANFNGGAGAITVAAAGSVSFGSLTFNTTGGAVSITEDDGTQLTGTSTGDSLTLVSSGAVTDATNTDVTIDNGNASITGTSISLADNAADTLSVSGTASFNGGAGAITVASAGAVNFGSLTFNTTGGAVSITEDDAMQLTGTSTADSLTLVSGGAVTDATNTDVTIDNGDASITGTSISLADQATDTLSVSGTASFNGGAGAITIAAAGAVSFGSLTFNTTGGAVSITEDDATQLTGTSTADSLTLVSSGAITDASGTSVTIDNGAASITGTSISLADNADTLSVSGNATLTATAGSIAVAAAGTVNFGSLDAGASTTVTISENSTMNLNVASGTTVTLTSETGAIVDNNAGANNVSATSAALSAVTGIGSGAALETTVTTLAFSNTTSGSVEISNTGALTIGSVGALTTSSNAGGAVVLQATSPVTFAVNTSSAGNLTAQAIESASTNTDNITVNAAVTVQSTSGDVLFEAGDRIIINNTATVQATAAGGDITFDSGFGDTDGDGAMTLDGAVSANTTNGVVTLDLNAQQGATQAGTGAITSNGLRLLSTGANGSFSLTSASNDVNTIAANTAGAISFTDSDGLTVGTVSTVGITTTNDSVTLDTGAAITIDDDILIGSGTLTLDSAAGVTQNASDDITAANLLLLGAGTFNINNAGNDVDVLAADLNAGTITFQDADNLEIGTVGATNGIATGDPAAGGAVTITATSGTITVNQAVSTATGTGGGISISGAVVLNATITAAGGTVTLNGANNGAFDLDINADLVSSASISLTAPRDILVGALVQTTGAGSDITLTADSETIPDGIGGVQIEAAGQVDSADAATISGSDLFADAGGTESVQVDADGTNNQILADGTIMIFSGPDAPAAADIEINGAIESTGAGTTIAIDAFQDVLFGANGDVTRSDAGASGLIHVFADQFDGTSTGGVITMADGTVINGGGGEIEVLADGNLTVGRIVTTDLINALSTSGSIVDGGDTGGADFVADSLAISGETGVGTDANALETQIATLAGRTESGDFHISNTGALTLDSVDLTTAIDALLGNISPVAGVAIEDAGNDNSGNDNITLVATGALTLNSTVDNNDGGTITLTSSGAAATNDLSINDDVSATGGNGTITLNAGDSILQGTTASVTAAGSGAIDYNAGTGTTTGVITMADGAEAVTTSGVITMDADGNITLGRLSTFNATTSAVTINSVTGGVIDGGDTGGEDISAMVGRVVINAVTGVGSSGAIETEAGSLDIDNATSGDIQINETSAVTLFDVQQATAGNITITAGGTITVDNAGAVTNAVSTVATGTIFLDANGASSNIAVNDGIQSAAGSITLNADNDITMDAPGDITSASGMIQIIADADTTTIGAITMTDGAVVNAGSNVINLAAGGNVTLGSLTTTSASNSAITVTSTNGSVLDGGDTHVDVVAASGRAVITAFGAITTGIGGANAIETTLASLDASVTTSGLINLVESDAITLFDVDTANGSITISAGGTITATDVASLTSADANDISLTATSGNILVALVTAGTTAADVTLIASTGSIEETANDAGADIIGDDLRLVASTGIGSVEKIEINGIDLAATTATGDISLNDTTSGLVIATIGGTVGVSITTGGAGDVIDISTNSPLTVNSPVSNAGGDDITLAANGSTATDDLAINADVTASGGNGDIFLYAGDSITLNSGGTADVTATGTGTILLSAGTNYNNGGGLTNGTSAGSITMTSGTTITSQDGDITLRALGNVAVSIVNADSNASGGIGDVLIIADYDGVATGLANNAGAITDNLTGEAVNITADLLTLRAATGIGSTDDIETTVNTLNAINTTSGNIQINETNAVTVTQATQNTAGNISIVAGGTITVDSAGLPVNAVSAAGTGTIALDANGAASDIVLNDGILSVSGSITLTADNDVTTDANGDITSTSGNLTVTADVLAGNNGGVIFMADGALWNAGSGAIDLDSDGNITLGGLQTTSVLATAVTIDTTSGAVIDGGDAHVDIVADSGTVTINAVTGVGSANAIDTTINFLSLTNSTSGNVDINETNSININRITQSAATGFVNVDANGTITVVDAQTGISALNGLVTLDANGTASNVAINHTVTTTGGNVLIDADNNITFDATSSISSTTGNVVLTADADNGGANSGAITMTDGSFVNAGTGTITATADGDITVSRFVTTNNTVNAILITSIEGGLVDGGDTGGPDIVANSASARTTITTATGIGAATGFGADPAIETQITTLDASTTAAGNIDIDETDAITLLDVDTFNGAIQVDAGNTLTAVDVSSANTSNDANDITLSTAAGNIEVGLIQAGAAGDVFLISAAAITDGDAGTDIFADDLVMTAMNGDIAASGDRLETDIDNVEAIASGGVYLTNIGNLVVGDASVMFGITAGDTVRIVNTTGTLRINERITAIGSLVALEAAGILSNLDDAGTPDSDIVSGTTALRSTAGIGQMGDVLEVTTGTLALSNTTSGDVFIRDTAGGLFIDNVDGLAQSTNTATGAISVATTAGQLTVDHNVTASSGVIILTAQDSTVGNENVVISTGTTVQSVTSNVTLNGGDAVTLQHDSAVITPATLFINTDEGNADIGGGFVTVNGDISALNTIITGDSDNDTFTIQPNDQVVDDDNVTTMTIDGEEGSDTYLIYMGALDGGATDVSIEDSGTNDTDSATVFATAADEDINVLNTVQDITQVQTGGFVDNMTISEFVNYDENLERLEVRGQDGTDAFHTNPSQTTFISIHGGNPQFGDALVSPPLTGDLTLITPPPVGDTIDFQPFDHRFNVLGRTIYTAQVQSGQPTALNPFQGVSLRNVESVPLTPQPPGSAVTDPPNERHFDFNHIDNEGDVSPTETDLFTYESVTDKTYFGDLVDDGMGGLVPLDYGFVVADPNLSVLESELDTSALTTQMDDLIRDGVTSTETETFRAVVANGWYLVSVKVTNVLNFQVRDGDNPTDILATNVSFTGHGEVNFVLLVTDGTMDLLLETGGTSGTRWRVDGIDIQPGVILTFGSPDPGFLAADGATIDNFTGYEAEPGSIVTIVAGIDADGDDIVDRSIEITSPDIDPDLDGVQVLVDGSGEFTYSLRRPTAVGTGLISFVQFDGRETGLLVLDYVRVSSRRFDFNTGVSVTQAPINSSPVVPNVAEIGGFIGVKPTDNFSQSFLGYGWDRLVDSTVNSGTTGFQANMRRDAHLGNANEGNSRFSAQIENGTYSVTATLGNPNGNAETIQILAEGVMVVSNVSVYSNNDRTETFVVTVSDGQLDLDFSSTKGTVWGIKGLTIIPSAMATGVTITTALGSVAGNGTTQDTISGTGPANSLITVSSTLGTIVTADADSKMVGTQVLTNGGGNWSFLLQRPAFGGTPTISATSVTGAGTVSSNGVVTYLGGSGGGENGSFFDFGSGAAQSGFTPVAANTAYTAGAGYGWTAGPQDQTDRGTLSGTNFSGLLGDAILGNVAGTFRTDLTTGAMYDVTVIFGAGTNMNVTVTNGSVISGLANVTGVSVPTGSFAHRSFVAQADNGRIDLQFATPSTTGSPWQVAGLIFRPLPLGTVTVSAPLGSATADGVTVDTFSVTGLEVGRTYTFSATGGTITNADQDSRFAGVQIVAAATTANVTLVRPATAQTVTVTVADVAGFERNTASRVYTVETVRRFDFNTLVSPTAGGFTGTSNGLWTAGATHGWVNKAPNTYDRTTTGGTVTTTNLYRDGIVGNEVKFRIAVDSAQTYDLQVYTGDRLLTTQVQIITEAGTVINGPVLTATNYATIALSNLTDVNGDGYLDLFFQKGPNGFQPLVSGIDIATDGNLPAAAPQMATITGSGSSTVSLGQVQTIVSAAIDRFAQAGLSDAALAHLRTVTVEVRDLGGKTLGLGSLNAIVLDDDAAGLGWFVDETPDSDSEFDIELAATVRSASEGVAAARYDLLSTVMHELGHTLGLSDLSPSVQPQSLMNGELSPGIRRLADVDSVFAANGWIEDNR